MGCSDASLWHDIVGDSTDTVIAMLTGGRRVTRVTLRKDREA